jgi:hypothetical protein
MENTTLYGGARGERMQYMGQMVWLLQNILANIFYWKLLSRAL